MVDWGLGNYERIALQLLPAAEMVIATADPVPGEHRGRHRMRIRYWVGDPRPA